MNNCSVTIATIKHPFNLLFTCVILIACSNKAPQKRDIDNRSIKNEYLTKYNAYSEWDTLKWFTVELQETFIEKNQPIVFEGRIYDIDKIDTIYRLKLINTGINSVSNYVAFVNVTKEQLEKIINSDHEEGLFVIQLEFINSSLPVVKTEYITEEEEDASGNIREYDREFSYIDDNNDALITLLKGRLIDCALTEL